MLVIRGAVFEAGVSRLSVWRAVSLFVLLSLSVVVQCAIMFIGISAAVLACTAGGSRVRVGRVRWQPVLLSGDAMFGCSLPSGSSAALSRESAGLHSGRVTGEGWMQLLLLILAVADRIATLCATVRQTQLPPQNAQQIACILDMPCSMTRYCFWR
jgi:hypothetical protein